MLTHIRATAKVSMPNNNLKHLRPPPPQNHTSVMTRHAPTLVLLANALLVLPALYLILALTSLVPSTVNNKSAGDLWNSVATVSGYMCAGAGAVWLSRQVFVGHAVPAFLLKCFYFTCVAVTLNPLLSPASGTDEAGLLGHGTARLIGLVLGGFVVDQVEESKAAAAAAASGAAGGGSKSDADL